MLTRKQRIQQIERALGKRRLIYFGTRGADAEPLLAIEQFSEVFSQIAPLDALAVKETCLESLTRERVDLDRYDIDADTRPEVGRMRQDLLSAFDTPAAVMAYRPCALLASAWFPRSDRVKYLGMFHAKQRAFEHKAWVETELQGLGVRTIPWEYYADNDANLIAERAQAQKTVLRANRTDGGVGVRLIDHHTRLDRQWPEHTDGFLAASQYLDSSIPLNVNACVFTGGEITLHGPSLQLIGIPEATKRRFGYCGNDFAAVGQLDTSILPELEAMVRTTGKWLASNGYRGAFGVDALVHDGKVYLTEVNPRFQGSSVISAFLDRQLDRPDIFLEHLAAFLALAPPDVSMSLADLAAGQPQMAHVVCHNTAGETLSFGKVATDALPVKCRLMPRDETAVAPEAIQFQAVFRESVTQTGLSLMPAPAAQVNALQERLVVRDRDLFSLSR